VEFKGGVGTHSGQEKTRNKTHHKERRGGKKKRGGTGGREPNKKENFYPKTTKKTYKTRGGNLWNYRYGILRGGKIGEKQKRDT